MKKRVLLLCNIQKNSTETIVDHVNSFSLYSKHQIDVIDPVGVTSLSDSLLENYDVVIIHYSIVIIFDHYLSPENRHVIKKFTGGKIIFIQDEYRWINLTIDCMNALGINTVFTCIPDQELSKVYPKEKLPNTKFINNLTGYVPERFLVHKAVNGLPDYDQRYNDVVYRGRKASFSGGKLVLEKYEIAQKFQQHAAPYNLKLDLAAKEKDRIYGQHWLDFLKNSKACLGTESGASVFDFEDSIRPTVMQYEAKNPDATYDEIEAKFFPGQDGIIKINQISPRIFEAIALKTLLILYEGEYSGIIKPWQHFVPLKKDLSNISEVVGILKDKTKWNKIVDLAFDEIVATNKYSYPAFIETVDLEIDDLFRTLNRASNTNSAKKFNPVKSNYSEFYIRKALGHLARKLKNKSLTQLISKARITLSMYFSKATIFFPNDGRSVILCKKNICCTNPLLKANKSIMALFSKKINKYEICPSCRWFLHGHNL